MNTNVRKIGLGLAAALACIASQRPAGAVTITPTFDSSITSSPDAAAIENTINTALNFYNTTLTNADNVSIYFGNRSRAKVAKSIK